MTEKLRKTKWYFEKVMKSKYQIISTLTVGGIMGVEKYVNISIMDTEMLIPLDLIQAETPKDITNMIIDYIKIRNPEYWL